MGKRMKKDDLLEPFNSAINGCFLQDIGRIHAYSDIQYYHPIVSLLKITNHLDKLSPMLLSSLLLFFSLIQLIVLGAGMLSPDLAQLGQIPCFYALHGVYMVFIWCLCTHFTPHAQVVGCCHRWDPSSPGYLPYFLVYLRHRSQAPQVASAHGYRQCRCPRRELNRPPGDRWGWEHVGTSPLNHKPLVKNHHFR